MIFFDEDVCRYDKAFHSTPLPETHILRDVFDEDACRCEHFTLHCWLMSLESVQRQNGIVARRALFRAEPLTSDVPLSSIDLTDQAQPADGFDHREKVLFTVLT